jgi:hypothetical protein
MCLWEAQTVTSTTPKLTTLKTTRTTKSTTSKSTRATKSTTYKSTTPKQLGRLNQQRPNQQQNQK